MNRNTRMMMLNKRRMGYESRGYEDNYNRYEEPENRFRDRRGREHYDNGRYAPMRNEYRNEYDDYIDEYDGGYDNRRSIGFNMGGYDNRNGMRLHYGGKSGKGMEHGGAMGGDFTAEDAEEWVKSMKNADGTSGEHWTMQQVKQLITQRRLDLDPIELYIALNATYSDLSKFFKKYNINNMDAYIDYAKMFWLEDEDAVDDKMAAYYMYVVK